MKIFRGRLKQDGMVVALVDGPDVESVEREIGHYAMMYGQDGPVQQELLVGKRWVVLLVSLNQTTGTQKAQNGNDAST